MFRAKMPPLLDGSALRRSLVQTPSERVMRKLSSTSPSAPTPPSTGKTRGKETFEHLRGILYPNSLVNGNTGTPVSFQAGMARLAEANARHVAKCVRVSVKATPARVSSCEAAAAVADVAIARWHLERAAPGGDEDGALQDVIDKSLAKDAICNIDDLLDHAE